MRRRATPLRFPRRTSPPSAMDQVSGSEARPALQPAVRESDSPYQGALLLTAFACRWHLRLQGRIVTWVYGPRLLGFIRNMRPLPRLRRVLPRLPTPRSRLRGDPRAGES